MAFVEKKTSASQGSNSAIQTPMCTYTHVRLYIYIHAYHICIIYICVCGYVYIIDHSDASSALLEICVNLAASKASASFMILCSSGLIFLPL